MKRLVAASFAMMTLTFVCSAQQATDPSTTRVPADAATLGNRKPTKKEKAPTTRTVTGQVTDETGQVLQGAMVTLTDDKTKEKRSFFTKKDGRYMFEELSFTNDYEVQARYKDRASDSRKVSQFDRTPRPVRILQVNTENTPATSAAASGPESKAPQLQR